MDSRGGSGSARTSPGTPAGSAARNGGPRSEQRAERCWFTGLSGSGKSTLAAAVELKLVKGGRAAYRLDGDNLRSGLNADLDFTRVRARGEHPARRRGRVLVRRRRGRRARRADQPVPPVSDNARQRARVRGSAVRRGPHGRPGRGVCDAGSEGSLRQGEDGSHRVIHGGRRSVRATGSSGARD